MKSGSATNSCTVLDSAAREKDMKYWEYLKLICSPCYAEGANIQRSEVGRTHQREARMLNQWIPSDLRIYDNPKMLQCRWSIATQRNKNIYIAQCPA